MKPLFVLVLTFVLSVLAIKILRGNYDFSLSGRIAMSAMLVFTAIGHFAFTKGMSMMLPDFIPYKIQVIYFTGLVEIAAAIGLLVPQVKVLTAWLLIVFFILLLPSNIYAAENHVDYQKGTYNGNGLSYLWFRIPLQILFIGWTYLSSIRF